MVLFTEQKGWEFTKAYLDEIDRSGEYCMMSSVNLGEVYYSIIREKSKSVADEVLDFILESQIEIVFPSLENTVQAALFKSRGGASYADCYAAALALEHGIPVLTGDQEFKAFESQGVSVKWLPANR